VNKIEIDYPPSGGAVLTYGGHVASVPPGSPTSVEDAIRVAAEEIAGQVGNLQIASGIINAPVEFTGSPDEIGAAYASHNFSYYEPEEPGRCINCDSKMGSISSEYPCGAIVPRHTYILVREVPASQEVS
jgi:hypothetical protein